MLLLVLANMRSRPLRLMAGVASVAVTVAIAAVAMAALERLSSWLSDWPSAVAIRGAGTYEPMPLSHAGRLRGVTGVTTAVEYSTVHDATLEGRSAPFSLVGASPGWIELISPHIIGAPPALLERWRADRQGLISDRRTAQRMGWKEGDLVTVTFVSLYTGRPDALQARFVGAYSGAFPAAIVRYDHLDQMTPLEHQAKVFSLIFGCRPPECAAAGRRATEILSTAGAPVQATPGEVWEATTLASEMSIVRLIQRACAVMSALAVLIVATTLSMSLRERRRELAALRAVGFRRSDVLRLVMAESVLTCSLGSVLGALVPFALFARTGLDMGPALMTNVTISPVHALVAAALGVPLGALVAAWPALSASRQDVVPILRGD